MARTLTPAEARAFYDRLGARQDWQAFYENPAIETLIAHAHFSDAHAVCEFGCGTGRLARRLLAHHLSPSATYLGLDISATMVELTRQRLAPWPGRARVAQTDGAPRIPAGDADFDRVVSTYVLDLLSDADIETLVAEAHRVLALSGRLCLVSLTCGHTPLSRLITGVWRRVHAWRPTLVGGCRPLALMDHVTGPKWRVRHRSISTSFGISSEIVVATRE